MLFLLAFVAIYAAQGAIVIDYSSITIPEDCFKVEVKESADMIMQSEMDLFDAERAQEIVVSIKACFDSEQIVGV